MTVVDERAGMPDEESLLVGTDPGEGETWDIQRLRCPECDRPIALVGDEERFPQHALLRTAWSPFSDETAACPGSGRPATDAQEPEEDGDFDPEPDLEALLALPPELDWRTQPFSDVRSVRAAVPLRPAQRLRRMGLRRR